MKIVYISKPSFGDCDFPLIKAMMEQGHEVVVIYLMSRYGMHSTIFDLKELKPECKIYKASDYPEMAGFSNYMPIKNVFMANDTEGKINFKSFKLSLEIMSFIRKQKADIVHYVEDISLLQVFPMWQFRKKLVVTIHDGQPHTGEKNWRCTFVRNVMKRYVNKFILLNQAEKKVFSDGYGVPMSHIYGSRLGYYDMLHSYGDSSVQKQNYILFFGRISPYKGVEYLLKAMERVHEKHPEVNLIIAGKPNYDIQWQEYRDLDYIEIRDRFIELDELADLIRGAKFTVCPYTDATQSGVVYSSFALNTPVIATRVGGLPEMIDDGETGIIIPPKDDDSLAEAILSYLDAPEILDQHSENIAASAHDGKGSWKKIAEEYTSIYNKQ
mgnify:CR=1 FL=1